MNKVGLGIKVFCKDCDNRKEYDECKVNIKKRDYVHDKNHVYHKCSEANKKGECRSFVAVK